MCTQLRLCAANHNAPPPGRLTATNKIVLCPVGAYFIRQMQQDSHSEAVSRLQILLMYAGRSAAGRVRGSLCHQIPLFSNTRGDSRHGTVQTAMLCCALRVPRTAAHVNRTQIPQMPLTIVV